MDYYRFFKPAVAILLLLAWTSCNKDRCVQTYTYYQPVYKTTQEVRDNIKSNPARAVEHPGKIYVYGRYIFLNELDRGIHIIDNSVPANPRQVSFIDIPGCVDLAVKGNILYADAYTDLVVLDINDPLQVTLKKVVEDVFPYRYYGMGFALDSSKLVVDWIKRDTTVEMECSGGLFGSGLFRKAVVMDNGGCINCGVRAYASSGGGQTTFGLGGSMARFAIMGSHLYTVSNDRLQVFGISRPESPARGQEIPLSWNIETIYPFKDRLFIGSNAGMYLFSVARPDQPVQIGKFEHARACDPVVGDDQYAYVTLRSGTACEGFNNQLDIVDIADPSKASLLKTYAMKNPHGLSKDGRLLFICDGAAGLKVYDASDKLNLKLLSVVEGIETYDVIATQGIALVTARGGLYQYEYSNPAALKLVSKLEAPY
jgi:LVIVD repeat